MSNTSRKSRHVRIRRAQGASLQPVKEYVLGMDRLIQENRELRQENLEQKSLLSEQNQVVMDRDRVIASLNAQLGAVLNSRTFRAARLVRILIPNGSLQEKLVLGAVRVVSILRHQGLRGLFHKETKGAPIAAPSLPAYTYEQWIENNEPDVAALQNQAEAIKDFSYTPLISIITPVYDPPVDVLEQAILSVCSQTYTHWELCLVNGNPANENVQKLLERYAAENPKVRLGFLPDNRGISGNSNACLELAQGDFVAFLDHDDTIAPFALFEVASYLNQHPDCDLLYSDHDILDATTGERKAPLFKPGWSPDIMLSSNYITHLTVVRRQLVQALGGFDSQTDGAQDWDLFLRVAEQTQHIGHIPKVLYHWRDSAVSTATNIYAKSYVPDAQFKSIAGHLARIGLSSPKAFLDSSGFIRVSWGQATQPGVTIIILSRGSNAMLERCVEFDRCQNDLSELRNINCQ